MKHYNKKNFLVKVCQTLSVDDAHNGRIAPFTLAVETIRFRGCVNALSVIWRLLSVNLVMM